jgi:hypothetical protein
LLARKTPSTAKEVFRPVAERNNASNHAGCVNKHIIDIPLNLVGESFTDTFILLIILGMSSKQSTKICKLLLSGADSILDITENTSYQAVKCGLRAGHNLRGFPVCVRTAARSSPKSTGVKLRSSTQTVTFHATTAVRTVEKAARFAASMPSLPLAHNPGYRLCAVYDVECFHTDMVGP